MKKIFKTLSKVLFVLVLGGVGGILFERTLIPYLAQREPFSNIPSLTIERTTIVNPKQEIIINEAQALEVATRVVYPTLVLIERLSVAGEVVATASGAVLTADGVVVTSDALITATGTYRIFREREAVPAIVVARDQSRGIALLKADLSGWPVVDFSGLKDLALGKRLFLLAGSKNPAYETVIAELQEGAITKVEGAGGPEISKALLGEHIGAPVFTIEGHLFGLVGDTGLIASSEIQDFFNETDITQMGDNI